jgi:MFS family permease
LQSRSASTRPAVAQSPPSEAGKGTSAFVLLASVQFTLILAISVLNIVLPDIQRDFGLSRGELALLGASYGMSFSGLLLLGGRLTDRYGARRILLAGVAVFGASSM